MRMRSTDVLVAALGAILAHEVAYGIVDLAAAPRHTHVPILLGLLLPLGAVVVSRLALRAFAAPLPSIRMLTLWQVLLFVLLETFEYVQIGGVAAMATSPAVLLGLVLQPVFAWFLRCSVRHGRRIAEWAVGSRPMTIDDPATQSIPEARSHPWSPLTRLPPLRGPPVSMAT